MAYNYVMRSAGNHLDLTSNQFASDYTIFCFDLDNTYSADRYPPLSGSISLSLQFSKISSEALVVLVFGEVQKTLFIDGQRQVHIE